jgi:hypothetical protein
LQLAKPAFQHPPAPTPKQTFTRLPQTASPDCARHTPHQLSSFLHSAQYLATPSTVYKLSCLDIILYSQSPTIPTLTTIYCAVVHSYRISLDPELFELPPQFQTQDPDDILAPARSSRTPSPPLFPSKQLFVTACHITRGASRSLCPASASTSQ